MNSKRKIAILLGLVICCEIVFAYLMSEISSNSPGFEIYDMKVFYSITSFHNNLSLLQSNSIQSLIQFRILDSFFPILYGLLLFTWLKHLQVANKMILGIPLIGMSFDYLENILLTIKTFFTNQHDYLIYVTNASTLIKFTCLLISVILIIYFQGKRKREK